MTKKLFIAVLLASFIVAPTLIIAKEDSLPEPGLTPDSPFYFLKTWKEKIQTFFTFGAKNKSKQYLHLAEVRFAEYQKMIEKGKTKIAEKTLEKYEKMLDRASQKVEELKEKKKDIKDIWEQLEQSMANRIEVLKENLEKVPEQAKEGIQRALDNSKQKLERFQEKFREKGLCENKCGDGVCQEIVCMGTGCPCAETKENCPQDCPVAPSPTPDETADWKTYKNENYGFEFKYPQDLNIGCDENACSFVLEPISKIEGVVETVSVSVSITDKTEFHTASKKIEEIQKIIDANYVTPPGTSGAETDYRRESARYFINNFESKNGVKIYHFNYVGKYSIVEREFYFDTEKDKTVHISIQSDLTCKCFGKDIDDSFFYYFKELKNLIDSIKLI